MGEGGTLDGETAFKLYDTYGFPYDLTEDALRSRRVAVDRAGFDAAMAQQKAAARAAWKGSGAAASDDLWFDIAEETGSTEFTGYSARPRARAEVIALVRDGARSRARRGRERRSLIVNQTPFYGESGGQVGDAGRIWTPERAARRGRDDQRRSSSGGCTRMCGDRGRVKRSAMRSSCGRCRPPRRDPRQPFLDPPAARGAARASRRACRAEGLAGRADDRLRFDFSHPKPR
jgi:alanyl-tRNA synthetase